MVCNFSHSIAHCCCLRHTRLSFRLKSAAGNRALYIPYLAKVGFKVGWETEKRLDSLWVELHAESLSLAQQDQKKWQVLEKNKDENFFGWHTPNKFLSTTHTFVLFVTGLGACWAGQKSGWGTVVFLSFFFMKQPTIQTNKRNNSSKKNLRLGGRSTNRQSYPSTRGIRQRLENPRSFIMKACIWRCICNKRGRKFQNPDLSNEV